MSIPPCIYDPVNRELRTVPAFFDNGKTYAGFVRDPGLRPGSSIEPGQYLGSLTWVDGTIIPLIAPELCSGELERFGQLRINLIHHRPSQVVLIIRT